MSLDDKAKAAADKAKSEEASALKHRISELQKENKRLQKTVHAQQEKIDHVSVSQAEQKAKQGQKIYKVKYEQSLEHIAKLERTLEVQASVSSRKPPKSRKRVQQAKGNTATAVAILSDWHAEEEVDPEKVNGLNSFTLADCTRRAKQTFDKILLLLDHERKLTNIRRMCLALLGDFISGYIHDELVEGNQLSPVLAIDFASDLLADGIVYLLEHGDLDEIVIPCQPGNHGRTTKKKRVATYYENSHEIGMYLGLRKRLTDPRLHWQIGKGYHNWVDIEGYKCRFHHGDSILYQGGVGGITIPVNKAISQWNKSITADYDFFGHYHQFIWSYRWICNGCLIGYGPYSLQIKAEYQPPSQTFAVIDRGRGLTRAMPIFCDVNRKEQMQTA